LQIGDRRYHAAARFAADGAATLTLDGAQSRALVLDHGDEIAVFIDGASWRLMQVDPLTPPAGADAHAGRLSAPMPGRVVQLLVAAGDTVSQGQALIVIEAMKMEHTIAAPRDGTIEAVRYAVGDLVEEGAELIALADAA
jgi:3-methylcrotonyl-CoA carboxylase alpha subunit